MNDKDPKSSPDNGKQSVGSESTNSKRSSGIFSFFKWLRPSGSAASRESLNSDKTNNSSSCESLSSVQSSGTVASFSFVEPSAYSNNLKHKKIPPSPETDTYKARIKQRDQRREKDKNLTLRKKYNLFFGRETLLKTVSSTEENSKSLPLMTKPALKEESREEGFHRRTNSDSSKVKKAGAYVHVKGKRKAPQPPGNTEDSNASLKKTTKRLAPKPPEQNSTIRSESSLSQQSEITSFRSEQINERTIEENNKVTSQSYTTTEENSRKYSSRSEDSSSETIRNKSTNSYLFDFIGKSSSQETKSNRDSILLDDPLQSQNNRNTELETKCLNSLNGILESASSSDVISNDSLKLDHGILKPVKDEEQNIYSECSPFSSKELSEDSKPWYKRQETAAAHLKREFFKSSLDNKYEPIDVLPEVSFTRNSSVDLSSKTKKEDKMEKKKEDKRKSGVSLLANISELDREAAEILQREKMKNADSFQEMPEFMKPKDDNNKTDTDSWVTPKRRSARDLIAKFNAITNVTKATVNTAFFGSTQKRDYFGKSSSKETKKKQETLLESHKKRLEMIDNKINNEKKTTMAPLMKSESASVVKKPDTPKAERKSWNCPKCYVENEYWRIICHVCSAIKPYFDELSASPNLKKSDKSFATKDTNQNQYERILERSKTQIGFSALSNMTSAKNKKTDLYTSASSENSNKTQDRKEEREKLKKMLIEMKNSLPKKAYPGKAQSKQQIITEKPELEVKKIETTIPVLDVDSSDTDNEEVEDIPSKIPVMIKQDEKKVDNIEEKVVSILIGTKETIYENIKVKKTSDPKPIKVSSSAQTASVVPKPPEPSKRANVTTMVKKKNSFEPMKVQDFEDIYSDQNGSSAARIYANLAQNDELSLFFNMPKNLTEMKNTLSKMKLQNKNKDTIEINRLLRKLEVAIAKGDLTQAADFAKELAQLRVNCSVIRQKSSSEEKEIEKDGFSVDMYVEDKVSHRGPFPFQVRSEQTVGELKKQVEKEFEIPVDVQRWILGKELATDDKTTLKDNNITEGCPIFLYLVAPAATENQEKPLKTAEPSTSSQNAERNEAPKEKKNDQPRLYPEINASKSGVYPEISENEARTDGPKIINAIPKAVEIPRKEDKDAGGSSASSSNSEDKRTETLNVKPEKHFFKEVVTQTVTTALFAPELEKGETENVEEYDVKTLKPNRTPVEWECHLCTLLNPVNSNICGVCATVRLSTPQKKERKHSANKPSAPPASPSGQTYRQLMNLDNEDIVHNTETFECVVCFNQVPPNEGVTLRECLHQFCKECVRHTVEFSEEAEIRCPYRDNDYSCNIALQDREIKALVSKTVYDQHLAKSVSQAENKIDKSFHCKTPDCKGWCIFEDNVNEFRCPVCRRVNCLTCQAIHMGLNCKQYQQRMTEEADCDENAKQTRQMLDKMVKNGEALKCPTCHVIMMKKWGCDWLRCSMCKTEICWVTRGPRWGPGGKGDTSGGCQCGVNGVKCHPKCNYCH
ncbi:uncharacterized protein LOC123310898 isoform X2 [Coccinella septempunctata]|uniref:uncharacterized protein LOC123310898 isoform X2 n=1 Tax=Coccinella septempunctata TaxID=41139 RepID=UPI001D093538|nr:uncharacterized protein LOC123310898 isoform X2 [Coccinella septempunctata]